MSKARKAPANVFSFAPVAPKVISAAVATSGGSPDPDGSGASSQPPAPGRAPRRSLLALACLSLLSLTALLLSPLSAAAAVITDRPLLFSFDGLHTAGSARANGVDADQSTGSVYALGREAEYVIGKSNLAGEAVDFTALGAPTLFYDAIHSQASASIAVDNSGVFGGLEEGEQGRIYLLQTHSYLGIGEIEAFSPAGEPLWELSVPPTTCDVAVDAEGHLWTADGTNRIVREYDKSGAPPAQIGSFSSAPSGGCQLAIDGSGEFAYLGRPLGVDKWELELVGGAVVGAAKVATFGSTTSRAIAVDQSSPAGHLFTLHGEEAGPFGSFKEFDSTGTLLGTYDGQEGIVHETQDIAHSSYEPPGEGPLDRLYVADRIRDVKVFGPRVTGTAPDVTNEAAFPVGPRSAVLNGKVNPLGIPNSYYFEWMRGTGREWGRSANRTPPASLPEEEAEFPVSSELTGLKSNTTYSVRLVGVNSENGLRNVSARVVFTTLLPPPPTVEDLQISGITTNSAHVAATIDPQGDETQWRLETSTDPACSTGFSPQPPETIPPGEAGSVEVESDLAGLPSQRYCLRIWAKNGNPDAAYSSTEEFTTLPVIPSQVFTAFAAPRTDTGARLNARVNPEGANSTYPLTYRFDYSEDGGETWTSLPDQTYTGGAREQIVLAQELAGLAPGTTYLYRFVAENAAGEASPQGEALAFMTRTKAAIEEAMPPPGSCPNEDARAAQRTAYLGFCRGIELVNNPDKGNGSIALLTNASTRQAISPAGDRVLWTVPAGAPGANNGALATFLAKRGPSGWRSTGLVPPGEAQLGGGAFRYGLIHATPDFSRFAFEVARPKGIFLAQEKTYVRLDDDHNQDVLWEATASEKVGTHSDDLAHLVFTGDGGEGTAGQLIDIGSGVPAVVSVMPDGQPSECGARMHSGEANSVWIVGYQNLAPSDGSRLYFEARPNGDCGAPEALWVRNRETEQTTLIDPGTVGGRLEFIRAMRDGRSAFFATYSQLDPADQNANGDVYRWDEASGASSCVTCVVADAHLSVSGTGGFADLMVSDDGSHLYFVSFEQLVPGHPGGLFVLSDGEIRFVGRTTDKEALGEANESSAWLSADGNVLLFKEYSSRNLTADEIARCGKENLYPCEEIYRYDDRDASLECISCARHGTTTHDVGVDSLSDGDFHLSADGSTVGFTTLEALVPADVNRDVDLYEWRNGAVRLVTDGLSDRLSSGSGGLSVRGVDADGTAILFQLAQPGLTGFEQDELGNAYVARIGGGFIPPTPPAHCTEDSCQRPLQAPPALDQPASSTFNGRGNLRQTRRRCRGATVRRRGRCVSKRALARRACRKQKGQAKRRCIRAQMRRLNRIQRCREKRGGARKRCLRRQSRGAPKRSNSRRAK